ncbi:hypothetical protein HMPREF0868_1628 [Mageeibacillus indolicus UPII9-5]|uniref:Uncharacterized protein n=1 Tax=Mageeibacillus indolicus (strain UPII9-5) TaxID=699246 RepID=D3QZI3_MAGIU|nr:hypothetical protein HMPREF0868_1628 [Mageeibacillus indolicus UPII9-5]
MVGGRCGKVGGWWLVAHSHKNGSDCDTHPEPIVNMFNAHV